MKFCGNGKPERPNVVCDRHVGPHRLCSGFDDDLNSYVDWPNPLWNDDKSTSKNVAEKAIHEMATRVKHREH